MSFEEFPVCFQSFICNEKARVDCFRLQYVEHFDSKKVVLFRKNIYICPNEVKAAFF